MAAFEIVIDNTWTYLKPKVEVSPEFIRYIETEMSYAREAYSSFRKTSVELEISMFERDRMRYPTGLYSILDKILTEHNYTFDIIDARHVPDLKLSLPMYEKKLRDYQEEVVEKSVKAERGVIKIATGGGKTVVAAAIVSRLNLKTLFVVYSIDLLEQTADEFENMFRVEVGKIGGGYCDIKQINVCTIQTLHSAFNLKYSAVDEENMFKEKISKHVLERKEEIRKVVEEAEVVIIDECHKATANTYIQMAQLWNNSYYRYSLSATPFRNKSIDMVLDAYSGRLICNITPSYLIDRSFLVAPDIHVLDPNEHTRYKFVRKSFRTIYENWIVHNDMRNQMIVDSTFRLLELGKSVLITVTRLPHGDILSEMLDKAGVKSIAFIKGEVNKQMRKDLLNQVRNKQLQVLVGSSLPYNEFIWIKSELLGITLIRIGEFVETILAKDKEEDVFYTLSFFNNKICWKKITHVVRHERQIPIIRTTVGTTRFVEVTQNHSLVTQKDGKLFEVEPKINNDVIVATSFPFDSEKIIEFDLVKEFRKVNHKSVEVWLDRYQKEININLSQATIRKMKTEYRYLMGFVDRKEYRKIEKRLESKSDYYKAFVLWFNENVKYYKGKLRTTLEKILLFCDYRKISATINWRRSRKHFSLPLFLSNSVELATICGMLIGDGAVNAPWRKYLSAKPNERFVYKNNKSRKENTVKLMVSYLKTIFPELEVVVTPDRGCCFGGQLICMLFDILGVNGKALTKKVPNYVFNSCSKIQMAFLYGYFLTDGSFDGDYNFVFGSVSKELTDGVVGLLLSNKFNKIKYSIVYPDEVPKRIRPEQRLIVSKNFAYRVCVAGNLFNLGRNPKMGSRSYLRNEINNQFYILPIIKTEQIEYDKKYVYDIAVEESENFFNSLGILCHNTVADEGIDIPALGSAIMAGGGKSLIKSLQRVGRTLRPYPSAENNEKDKAIIVDFYDRLRYLTGHSKKRIKIYESEPRFNVYKHF